MPDLMQTIVVAYDDPGSATLQRAVELAQALGSRLVVTNVAAGGEGPDIERAERDAEGRLAEAMEVLGSRGVDAEYVRTAGNPGEAIVALAQERRADLIVVGTRRKGFFERLVEGSVLQEVVRHTPCDVLVVR
jgi:nucleotide-binding universal stress UspA family protein